MRPTRAIGAPGASFSKVDSSVTIFTSESFASAVAWLSPNRAKSEYLAMLLREIEWLGLTGLGAISTFGVRYLGEQELLGIRSEEHTSELQSH